MLGSQKCPLAFLNFTLFTFRILLTNLEPTSKGCHRILNPLWKRTVSSSILSPSADAVKTWGFWQKWSWRVTKEELSGWEERAIQTHVLVLSHLENGLSDSSSACLDVSVLLSCHWQIITVTPSRRCKSSSPPCNLWFSPDPHPSCTLWAGSWSRDPGEPHRGSGKPQCSSGDRGTWPQQPQGLTGGCQ